MGSLRWFTAAVLLVSAAASLPAVRAQASEWTTIRDDAGITSFRRELAGAPLPAFRARAVFQYDMWFLLAILEDVDRAVEWTAHCVEMRQVRRLSTREMLVYARMDAPWPVHDRDVIVHISVQDAAASELTVAIRSTDLGEQQAHEGVVRMPHMRASYRFRPIDAGRTEVQYELEVDTGGALPDWLKALVSRNLAHDTLSRLRGRAAWAKERALYLQRADELRIAATLRGDRG